MNLKSRNNILIRFNILVITYYIYNITIGCCPDHYWREVGGEVTGGKVSSDCVIYDRVVSQGDDHTANNPPASI